MGAGPGVDCSENHHRSLTFSTTRYSGANPMVRHFIDFSFSFVIPPRSSLFPGITFPNNPSATKAHLRRGGQAKPLFTTVTPSWLS